jgi:DNA-binding protein H-NS
MEKFKQEEEERQRLENAMRERIEKRKKELAAKRGIHPLSVSLIFVVIKLIVTNRFLD